MVFNRPSNYNRCTNATFLHIALHIHILIARFINDFSEICYYASEPKSGSYGPTDARNAGYLCPPLAGTLNVPKLATSAILRDIWLPLMIYLLNGIGGRAICRMLAIYRMFPRQDSYDYDKY